MEENKEHIVAKWLEGSVSNEHLDSYYDEHLSRDLTIIRDTIDVMTIPEIDSEALLGRIQSGLESKKPSKVYALKYWIGGIAAILLTVLAYTAVLEDSIQVNNETLAYSTHQLPDGSTVRLNANSQIEYGKDFGDDRILTLKGEAFFEVMKGKSFEVHTDNGVVSVLGTSFNVFSRKNSFSVACKTGKVKVIADQDFILTPGENVNIYNRNSALEGQIIIEDIGSWQHGESKFKSTPFHEVVLALEAQYNIKVEGSLLDGAQKFSGSFVHYDLDKALRMVFLPMGISYEYDKKNKIITIQ